MELLYYPSLLLIDEGTSGLDSSTATSIINLVRNKSVANVFPVVVTIHQPSQLIFESFDKILLLACGKCFYFGKPSSVLSYFSSLGCTPTIVDQPLAEFCLDVLKEFYFDRNAPQQDTILVQNWSEGQELMTLCGLKHSYDNNSEAKDTTKYPGVIQEIAALDIHDKEEICDGPIHFCDCYPSSYTPQYFGLLVRSYRIIKVKLMSILLFLIYFYFIFLNCISCLPFSFSILYFPFFLNSRQGLDF